MIMSEQRNFTIFYCWQSTNTAHVKEIRDSLEAAVKEINSSNLSVHVELIDSNTGHIGSSHTQSMIYKNILISDIFICDFSPIIVGENLHNPNSNVMWELGVAVNNIGWEHILCITWKKEKFEFFPFDVKSNHIYHLSGAGSHKLSSLIEVIIKHHDETIVKFCKEKERYEIIKYPKLIIGYWGSIIDGDAYYFQDGNIGKKREVSNKGTNYYKLRYTIEEEENLLTINVESPTDNFFRIQHQYKILQLTSNSLIIKENGRGIIAFKKGDYNKFR